MNLHSRAHSVVSGRCSRCAGRGAFPPRRTARVEEQRPPMSSTTSRSVLSAPCSGTTRAVAKSQQATSGRFSRGNASTCCIRPWNSRRRRGTTWHQSLGDSAFRRTAVVQRHHDCAGRGEKIFAGRTREWTRHAPNAGAAPLQGLTGLLPREGIGIRSRRHWPDQPVSVRCARERRNRESGAGDREDRGKA